MEVITQSTDNFTNCMLPTELINLIYSYIAFNERNKLLKKKHSMDYLQEKIIAFPQNRNTIEKLYQMADSCEKILLLYYPDGCVIRDCGKYNNNNDSSALSFDDNKYYYEQYKQQWDTEKTTQKIIERFINVIMLCLKTYTKMYSKKMDRVVCRQNEKIIFQLYSNIIMHKNNNTFIPSFFANTKPTINPNAHNNLIHFIH